jgi:hypothetical protein
VNQSNGPGVWSAYRWDRNVGDSAELRWWQTNDEMGTMRMDRTGYLAGGGDDRLQSQSSGFYRQRIYPVTGYAAGPPRVVSVTGAPNTDGFTGTLIAVIIPASASARIGRAPVSSLGAASVTVSSDFLDSLGATVTPVGGDTLAVFRDTSQMDAFCPEARINGSTYLTRLINNTSVGIQASWGACGNYLDTWSEPLLQSATRSCCYRDHSTWSGIDPGYTRHPYGGGDWYKIALREFLHQWKQRARTAQALTGRDPFFRVSGEDIDETVLDRIDWCWHPVSAGYLWRVTKVGGAVADPAIHKYKTIPLWSVVYPGRTMGRGLDNELSSIILEPVLYADDELIRFFGYCLGVEWPYGITWPTLSLYEDSTIALKDWFDDTQYVSGGGLVPNKVKQIRDLWVQIMRAELNFLLDRGFRYGEMMPPAVVDIAATTTTTGMAQSTWTAGAPNYQSYDTIYERTAFPRVTHSFWKAADGTLVGVFCNWSDTAGAWSGTIDTAAFGVGGPGSTGAKRMTVMRVDSTEAVDLDITFDGDTGVLSMGSVAAYSMAAVFFTPERSSGMTLADLKQCVLDWLQTTFADGPWTENEVERHLRDGELIVHSMAAEKFEDFCITSALVSEVSGTAIIDLPANVFRVVKVERVVGGLATTAAPIPLRKMSRNVTDEQLARGSRWPYGAITPGTAESPMNYYQHGQKSIELFPTPATTVTNSLKVTYIYVPDPMVDDTDVPFQEAHGPGGVGKDSITSFHDILCKYAAEMCFLKEEAYPQADRVKQERMMRQAQLMQHLSHMNVQEPRYIRNPDMGW